MYQYFIGLLCWAAATSIYAQEGYYERIEADVTETIELRADYTFTYQYKGSWAKSTTQGKWKAVGGGQISLTSDKQLDYWVDETFNEKFKGVRICITSPKMKQAPRSIEKVMLNGSIRCSANADFALKEMEIRSKLMTTGTPTQRDSAKQAFQPAHYTVTTVPESIDTIALFFDKKCLKYVPESGLANEFVFRTKFAEDDLYRYFDNEIWIWDKKGLMNETSNHKYKKGKK